MEVLFSPNRGLRGWPAHQVGFADLPGADAGVVQQRGGQRVCPGDTSSPSSHGRTALCCYHDRLDLRERPGPFSVPGPLVPVHPNALRLGGVPATFTSIPSIPATGAGRFTLEVYRCKDILKERQAGCSCMRDLISWRILQKRPLRPLLPGDLAAMDPDIQPGRDGRH